MVNSAQYSSSGNKTLDISGTDYETWRANVSFEKTGSNPTAELHDEGILVETSAPTIDNTSLSPNSTEETLSESPVTLEADISDPDLAKSQGDTLTADWYVDGEQRGSTTITENGTASFELDNIEAGGHSWHVDVSDSYGHTTESATGEFAVPSQLHVHYETQPEKRITDENLSLTVRFYPLQAGDSSAVVTRPVENGSVDLAGLPVDQRFVVTARANETGRFTYRRIVVNSLYESNRIYLLNESEPHSRVTFELDDPTGQFPPEETVFYVEKPIEQNGSTQYATIAGDTFGSTGRFPVVLQDDERYRLRVESATGTTERILGAYSVSGSGIEPIQIQQIQPQSDTDAGSIVYGGLTTFNGSSSIAVRHRDPGGNAASVTYQVRQDGEVVVANTTSAQDKFAHQYPFATSGTTYTVEYWITSADGTVTNDEFAVGQIPGVADRFGVDPQVLGIISWGLILSVMGLLAIANAKLAPLGGTGMATGLSLLGTIAIPPPVLGVAGAISVLSLFGGGR